MRVPLELPFQLRTPDAISSAIISAAQQGKLAIPSQRGGTCANDGLAVTLFYADGLREYFWQKYIFNAPGQVLDTEDCEKILNTQRDAGPNPYAVVECWKRLCAARILSIAQQRVYYEAPRPGRSPTDHCGMQCLGLAQLYANITSGDLGRETVGLTSTAERLIMDAILTSERNANPAFTFSTAPEGGELVSILLDFDTVDQLTFGANAGAPLSFTPTSSPQNGHVVSIVRIGRAWYWCDNNIGGAIALDQLQDPSVYRWGYMYNPPTKTYSILIAPPRTNNFEVAKAIQIGRCGELSGRESERHRISVYRAGPGVQRNIVAYRVPTMEPLQAAFPQQQPPTRTGVSNYGQPLRNSNDPQANVKDAFNTWNQWGGRRRLKRTSRQSSLPKPKAPSSGHLRGYTRRRRALRSGTGGYRATKTGRKV
jgi:hypothetical protein